MMRTDLWSEFEACGITERECRELDRTDVRSWLRDALVYGRSQDCDSSVRVALRALTAMDEYEVQVTAADADWLLGQTDGTTLWLNHGGIVPANALRNEIVNQIVQHLRDGRPFADGEVWKLSQADDGRWWLGTDRAAYCEVLRDWKCAD
jgi:hypothetical protein